MIGGESRRMVSTGVVARGWRNDVYSHNVETSEAPNVDNPANPANLANTHHRF